jgi:hypothetical protein
VNKLEKHIKELMDFGLEKSVAQEIVSSHTHEQMETILDFLTNYGQFVVIP